MKRKALIATLALCTMFSSITPAYAAVTPDANSTAAETPIEAAITADTEKSSCEVTATLAENFSVTIPKSVILGGESKKGSYTVKVTGNLAGDHYVEVYAPENVTLKSSGKADVSGTITQSITKFRDANYTTTLSSDEKKIGSGDVTGEIAASSLTAGPWKGTFDFKITLVEPTSRTTE
jgi:hypothetical protein